MSYSLTLIFHLKEDPSGKQDTLYHEDK